MDARTARLVQIGLGLLLVAVVAAAIVFIGGDATPASRPEPVESVSPTDGSQAPRQQPVVVDMAVGYDVTLSVQDRSSGAWVPVPEAETGFEPATGVLTWVPPPDTAPAGQLRLRVDFRATTGLPETGSYEWEIRTY